LEGEIKSLKEDKFDNLKEKVNGVETRFRYIEQKFIDQSVHIAPEVRKKIKEEEKDEQ
jgi:hypothetical protein